MREEPDYLWEFFTHQNNILAGLGSLAIATVLSIPFGFGIGSLPLIAFGAAELIASMYVPARIDFQENVKRRVREEQRTKARTRIFEEIAARSGGRPAPRLMNAWTRMEDRVRALGKFAADGRSTLSKQDFERLQDATLDYLSLWLADLVIDDRSRSVDIDDIQYRLEHIEEELGVAEGKTDQRNLLLAKKEYQALIERHRRMQSRKVALEAAMLSMPDQVEEIYQMVAASPYSQNLGGKLEESLSKLRLEEDLEAELASDLGEALPELPVRKAQPTQDNVRQLAAAKAAAQQKQAGGR